MAAVGHRQRFAGPAILIVLLLLSLACSGGQAPSSGATETLEQCHAAVDAMLSRWQDDKAPGAMVMVIHRGEIVFERGYGLADVEARRPIGPRTVFRLASVSKQFTAMAILLLDEAGALDLDDPLVDHLPELARYGRGITLRHLLHHTAGLPEYYDELERRASESRRPLGGFLPDNGQGLQILREMGADFVAGQRFTYCNACYDLLAVVVSRVSGRSFADFVEQRIFEPLGMRDSFVFRLGQPVRAGTARSYSPLRGRMVADSEHLLDGIVGSGGVFSSTADLFLWDQALYSNALVSRDSLEQAFSRGRLSDGRLLDYGFGWMIDRYRGIERLSHTGGWLGFRTYIARYPARQLTVVLLSNRADFERWSLGERLADIYLDFARQRKGPRTRGEPVAHQFSPSPFSFRGVNHLRPRSWYLPTEAQALMMAARSNAAVGGRMPPRRNRDGRDEQILRSLRGEEAASLRRLEREPREFAQGYR